MPSKERVPVKRRRRRKSIAIDKWLWGFLTINVLLGALFSPLTSLRKVRIIGAPEDDQARLTDRLQNVRGLPLAQVSENYLISQVLSNPEIETVRYNPNLFGRAVLRMSLRKPVAQIINSKTYLDLSGTPFKSLRSYESLPTVTPTQGAFSSSMMIVSGWEIGNVAKICSKLSEQVPNVSWNLAVDDRWEISLLADGGTEVALGSSDSWFTKVKKLRDILQANPDLLKKVRTINLTFPEAPQVVPR